ncbi:hypothetical protein GOV09_04510 [Candidatus Woesearchaeota archaeon]|nr:hypothetical protein [Candidatus Woesearchaeota archaeon]
MAKRNVVESYIDGFDHALGGGIPAENIVIIHGSAGTMKSSLCFNILYNEILSGKKGVYISIEQSSLSLLRQVVSLGFDISKINIEVLNDANDVIKGLSRLKSGDPNKLTLIDFGSIRKELRKKVKGKVKNEYEFGPGMITSILTMAQTLVQKDLCDIIIIDSLTALYSLTKMEDPRSDIFYLFEYLRDLGISAFIISEESADNSYTRLDIESYLADGIIHLQLTERNRKVTREISVIKMRSTSCNNDIFTLEFDGKKFKALYGGKIPLV